MKKPSLIMQIYQFIKEKRGNIVHSGDIELFGQNLGYKASHADRRARDLVEPEKTVKGKKQPNPAYSPMIQSLRVNGCAAYRYRIEDEQSFTPVKVGEEVIPVPSLF